MNTRSKHTIIAVTVLIMLSLFTGCTGGGSDGDGEFIAKHDLHEHGEIEIEGTDLASCTKDSGISADAGDYTADDHVIKVNISKESEGLYPNPHFERSNAKNAIRRLDAVVPMTSADGTLIDPDTQTHPLVVSYAEQVIGDYAMNDGSADIGDPYHIDDVFVSTSLDNGKTWKKINVSRTAEKNSMNVTWDGATVVYPGHSHKPTMEVNANRILVAWHDKYCPSSNPFDLQLVDGKYPDDFYQVNGIQGSINYNLDGSPDPTTGEPLLAPNGNEVYEVPFSCVWTARGIFELETGEILWHKAEQLTSGTRDANKLWIAAADVGFAMAWQEDPEGLRQGQGAGPGEGWSGATTNHGSDIWYSYLKIEDFDAVDTSEEAITEEDNVTKVTSLNRFTYPVRVTDNEVCLKDDTKPYCQEIHCDSYAISHKSTAEKCVTKTLDPLWDDGTAVVLDGDTGASRPAMTIVRTNADEDLVLFAYEETKGLSDKSSGSTETDIALEGKVIYYERFPFTQPATISPGNVVNTRAPRQETGEMIYENARRVLIVKQVDPCDEGQYAFGLLYKQGVETRGGSSDMFLRMNPGFEAESFEAPLNVSAMEVVVPDGTDYNVMWSPDNLQDFSYDNLEENTFSPRGFIRADDIYIGFEYTPRYDATLQDNLPNTFFIHRFTDGAWQGPQQISQIAGPKISTLDPNFVPTPKGSYDTSGLETDKSNPDVLFLTYGTFDMESGHELDLYYTRSTDKGVTWETVLNENNESVNAKLAKLQDVAEMEVQSLPTPDGSVLYNAWLQEQPRDAYLAGTEVFDEDGMTVAEHFKGMDSWVGRVDFNVTTEVVE